MKDYLTSHPYAKIGVFALLLIPFVLLINAYSPPAAKIPEGYSSTILAFEFVSNPSELNRVLQPLTEKEIKDLDVINYIDFGFMVFYTALLILFISKSYSIHHKIFIRYAMILVLLILIADAIENWHLLRLSSLYLHGEPQSSWIGSIGMLKAFTWIKWGSLAFVFAFFGMFLKRLGWLSRLVGLLFLIPLILLCLVVVRGGPKIEDLFASSIFMSFFILVIYCFSYRHEIETPSAQ